MTPPNPIAYVIGGARCVWDDLAPVYDRLLEDRAGATLFVVNDIGMYCQLPFEHWVSYHGAYLVHWAWLWAAHNPKKPKPALHSFVPADKPQMERWKTWGIELWLKHSVGSSAHLAVEIALEMGFLEVRLAGVPLDSSGRFFDPPGRGGTMSHDYYRQTWIQWKKDHPDKAEKVKAASGWTKDHFGEWQSH